MGETRRRLTVWILQAGEELPTDPGPPRLLRHAILAELLADRGHNVVFWSSSFSHQQKLQRSRVTVAMDTGHGYPAVLLKSPTYRSNVSMARIRSHQVTGAQFRRHSAQYQRPDVILAGYPTIELAHAGARYARTHDVPLVVDCRDLWPEIIALQAPMPARMAGAPLLAHWRRLRREIMAGASSIVGITEEFVDWGVREAGRRRTELDVAFPLAVPRSGVSDEAMQQADTTMSRLVGTKAAGQVWAVYAGSLGRRTDLATLSEAVKQLPQSSPPGIRVLVCGRGDLEDRIARTATLQQGLTFLGKRSAAEVSWLLQRADVGVLPYPSTPDYAMSYPNKVGEYMSQGLPVLTCLGGITGELLRTHNLGIFYRAGDADSCAEALRETARAGLAPGTAERARKVFEDMFNPQVVYPAFASHIERLAEGPTRSGRDVGA